MNPKFKNPVDKALDSFQMEFSVNRETFKSDIITLNMGTLANVNTGSKSCKILDEEGNPSKDWSICNVDSLSNLILKPINDIPTSKKYSLVLPQVTLFEGSVKDFVGVGVYGKLADSSGI